jgi:hypothetical protein
METIRQAMGEQGIQCEAIADGAFLFLTAAPEKIAAAQGLVTYLGASRSEAFRIDLVREARPVGGPEGAWRPYGGPIEMLCLGGRLGWAQAGREDLFIGDYDALPRRSARLGAGRA